MNLQEYLRILRRNWIWIVAFSLLGLLLSGVATIVVKPNYTATTRLFVAIQNSGSVQELQQGNTFSQARVQSYVKIATTPAVLQPAINRLGIETTAENLAESVKASTDLDTVLINISVTDHSSVQAAAIAQAVADSLISSVDELEKPKSGGVSPVTLSVVAPAKAPAEPSSPNAKLNLLLGSLTGLALGTVLALLRTSLDIRIRSEADIRRITESPVLGGIAADPTAAETPLLTEAAQRSPRAESFRQLRTNMQFATVSRQVKTILVTSSLPGEGKSSTATNLAIAMARSGQAVCLVDADLRRPMISEYLGLERNAGLTTALLGAADVNDLLQPWGGDNLFVLTSGQIPPNPSELLGSRSMRALIERLETTFDVVIIDTPPLLPVTDAAVLSQHVGGVVVVVGTQQVTNKDLEKSLNSLELVSANLLGIVMNRTPTRGPDAYGYGSYGYESFENEPSTPSFSLKERAETMEFPSPHNDDDEFQRLLHAQESKSTASRFPQRLARRRED
ncbi:polysaccharide biosynthesis tyrosine autokinase [Pseudarthrobacter sp. 1C304]|uniref:polysaccharide biosynthesis tyrosine autokinase n=1 Tax=Pseudarthrobacter sp. 1C304 TaxID=3457438 RepID=UPI003FD2903A